LEEVSGTSPGPDGGTCTGDLPKDTYFAGSLIPSEEAELSGLSEDLQSKLSPTALQVDFLLDGDTGAGLTVAVSGNVYYRSFPTYEEQFVDNPDHIPDADNEDGEAENSQQNGTFATVFRRLQFESEPIKVELPQGEDLSDGDSVSTRVENSVLESLRERLRERLSSIDASDTEPPVWRASADLTALGEVTLGSGIDGGLSVRIERDDYSGDYEFGSVVSLDGDAATALLP
jgi:hypothetical protein